MVQKLKEHDVLKDDEAPVHLLELLSAVADNPANKDLGDYEEKGLDHTNSGDVDLNPPTDNTVEYFENISSKSLKHFDTSGDQKESTKHTNGPIVDTAHTVTIVLEDNNINMDL